MKPHEFESASLGEEVYSGHILVCAEIVAITVLLVQSDNDKHPVLADAPLVFPLHYQTPHHRDIRL